MLATMTVAVSVPSFETEGAPWRSTESTSSFEPERMRWGSDVSKRSDWVTKVVAAKAARATEKVTAAAMRRAAHRKMRPVAEAHGWRAPSLVRLASNGANGRVAPLPKG